MTDVGSVKMLDTAAVSTLGHVRIESWSAEYDLVADAFALTVFWQGYGYGQRIPAASALGVVAMFEAASRAGVAVFYDGQGGNLRWSIERVPA